MEKGRTITPTFLLKFKIIVADWEEDELIIRTQNVLDDRLWAKICSLLG